MKWLLIAIFVTPTGDEPPLVTTYETESKCIAAAEAFVAQHPEFEFQNPSEGSVIHPVLRSYVACRPETQDQPE
jgi:hypothetical protein